MLEKLPLKVEAIQTGNAAEFGSQFYHHALNGGMATSTSSRPRQTGGQGRARSKRIDAEEFYRRPKGVVIDDTELFNDDSKNERTSTTSTDPMEDLVGQTPYERTPAEGHGPGVNEHRQLRN